MEYKILYFKGKRSNNCKTLLKKELIVYLKEEYKEGHIPSRREIEKTFHMHIGSISKNINSLYEEAGLKYKLVQNQDIKATKAELLLKLILENISLFGLELIKYRNVHEREIDIIAKETKRIVGIELKAYNKNEKLKKRDIEQVSRFIKKENLDEVIIITTTDLSDIGLILPPNIRIIKFEALKKLLPKEGDENLDYIRNYSVSRENVQKESKRQKILNYVLDNYKKYGKKSSHNDIKKELHLCVYTYFNGLFEIYKLLKIPPPLKGMKGKGAKLPDIECINLWKNEFKRYILSEVKQGNGYPSGEKIEKYFGISHIWNITKVSDLYRELNLKPYLEREKRITSVQES